MLSDAEFDGGDSETENVPEVDLLEQLSKLQIGEHEDENDHESVSKASSKLLLRSNPVFDEKRISSKVKIFMECRFRLSMFCNSFCYFAFELILVSENH